MNQVSFISVLSQFESSTLWGWHFLVPSTIAAQFVNGKDRRVICTINEIKLHCALMPNKETWFIMINQGVQKKLGVALNSEISVLIEKDTSKYGMPIPEEFQEVLLQDPDADRYFHKLTPGKQRSLLYIIGKVKNSESRIRKSLAIADHLTANKGEIDYKMLNEALKEYNRM
ncbi:MAG: DUF1905 domain-containing protein [Saprospiraceae bacterium]|nr:DUF1905 domain-containing protein [Saprospiraceae bacterium]